MKCLVAVLFCLSAGLPAFAQSRDQVDMELMTYPEIADAMRAGKTTVLVYNGGTEQRGPHAVVGGHSLVARRGSVEIARKLGNALVAPVLPFSIAGSHLNSKWPGSVNLSGQLFSAVNEAVADSMVVNGFKTVVLMGDHGGGQRELRALAARLDAKYAPKGTHVFYCGDVYEKAVREADAYVAAHNLPASSHGGVRDTSILMYLGGDAYVRKDKLVAGDPVVPAGRPADPSKPRVNNGVVGDPRPSTPELGKLFFEMQVNDAVAEINRLTKRSVPVAASRPAAERLTIPYLANASKPADLDFAAAECEAEGGDQMACGFRQVFLTAAASDPTMCVITTNGYDRTFRRETATRWTSAGAPSGECAVVETTTLEDGGGTHWTMTIRSAATRTGDQAACRAASEGPEIYDWRSVKRALPCTSIQPGAIER